MDKILKNATVVTSGYVKKMDIGIQGGRIAALAESLDEPGEVIDCTGKLVLAGGVDVHAHLLFGLCVKQIPIGEQIACIPGDRSQRGAQVVGDGPEQVGAQLFIFRQDSGSFLLLQILLVFQSEGAFPQDREQDAGLEGVQRAVRCGDSHDPVHQIAGPDG